MPIRFIFISSSFQKSANFHRDLKFLFLFANTFLQHKRTIVQKKILNFKKIKFFFCKAADSTRCAFIIPIPTVKVAVSYE